LKSPELNEYCFKEYLPRLSPGRALVVHQDYFNGDLPFIHVNQERLSSKFEYVGEISSTAVFRLLYRINQEEIEEMFDNPPTGQDRMALVAQASQRSIDPYRRLMMAFSRLRTILQF